MYSCCKVVYTCVPFFFFVIFAQGTNCNSLVDNRNGFCIWNPNGEFDLRKFGALQTVFENLMSG